MRVLSGIQPSGQLHLGNYFGSIKPNVAFVGKAEQNYYLIVDLHAMTTMQDPAKLKQYREDAVLDLLACGFDPEKAVLFFQSAVPEHTQLMWILATVSPMGLLERAVSYKEKVEKGIAASVGLFIYPVLMAADILLYGANLVPVGKDQKQHVEMTRDIAIKFNNAYGDTLVVPEPLIREEVAVVPGTDGQKMSKSYNNMIPLFGDEKEIRRAIMGIVTDSKGVADPKNPEASVVYNIHKLFLTSPQAKELADRYRKPGLGYGDAKKMLFEAYMDHFGSMRRKREELEKKPEYVRNVLEAGQRKAHHIAQETLNRVYEAVGIR